MCREADLLAQLARWHQRYYVRKVVVEQSASTGIVEGALSLHLPVETVAPMPGAQVGAFTRLYCLARDGQLTIPAGAENLFNELKIPQHHVGDTGIPRFSAPSGRHDDT